MPISILEDSLLIDIYYDCIESEFEDSICISFFEECPDDEKIFRYGQTNIYVNVEQARWLAQALLDAVEERCDDSELSEE